MSSPRRSKTPRWADHAEFDSGDPFRLDQRIDLIGALRCSVKGVRIAYDPNMNVFPVDPDVAACRLLAALADDAVLGASDACERLKPWHVPTRAARSDLCG